VGKQLAPVASTIERMGLVNLLKGHFDVPLNVVNVSHVAEQRGIKVRTIKMDEDGGNGGAAGPQLTLEIKGPPGAVDETTPKGEETRRIVGRVYSDMRPRILEVNRYHMDMVPAGGMVLIQNEDRPGMIGLVGTEFGQAQVNIADMAISRRDLGGQVTALMVLKVDSAPPESLINRLRARPGILKVAYVKLGAEK
jgi:D-3-phosphoglycerate dehydrogenase / 2-oxoglutarate reductase